MQHDITHGRSPLATEPLPQIAPPAPIRQEELFLYLDLKEAGREARLLAQSIRQRLNQGATVEAGSLTARLNSIERRRFSQRDVAQVVGQQAMRKLLNQMPLVTSQELVVADNVAPRLAEI